MNTSLDRKKNLSNERYYGKFRGVVIDNRDPKKLGRIKLRIPAVRDGIDTGWALPCVPFGGAPQLGMFMIPEVGSMAWVEFESGELDHPIWVGTFWEKEGDAPSAAGSDNPTTRLIRTTSGHLLQFDDVDGEELVRLRHASSAEMQIDPNGSITLVDASGAILNMDAVGQEIILEDSNGNIWAMDSTGSKIEDSNGNVLEMKAAGITAKAPKIVIKGSEVHLGDEGGEPIIKGQSFLSLFATHIHTVAPVVGGATSPPIPQGEMASLSTTVKSI